MLQTVRCRRSRLSPIPWSATFHSADGKHLQEVWCQQL